MQTREIKGNDLKKALKAILKEALKIEEIKKIMEVIEKVKELEKNVEDLRTKVKELGKEELMQIIEEIEEIGKIIEEIKKEKVKELGNKLKDLDKKVKDLRTKIEELGKEELKINIDNIIEEIKEKVEKLGNKVKEKTIEEMMEKIEELKKTEEMMKKIKELEQNLTILNDIVEKVIYFPLELKLTDILEKILISILNPELNKRDILEEVRQLALQSSISEDLKSYLCNYGLKIREMVKFIREMVKLKKSENEKLKGFYVIKHKMLPEEFEDTERAKRFRDFTIELFCEIQKYRNNTG